MPTKYLGSVAGDFQYIPGLKHDIPETLGKMNRATSDSITPDK